MTGMIQTVRSRVSRISRVLVASTASFLNNIVGHQHFFHFIILAPFWLFMIKWRASNFGFKTQEIITSKCVNIDFWIYMSVITETVRRLVTRESFFLTAASSESQISVWLVGLGGIGLLFGNVHHWLMANWGSILIVALIFAVAAWLKNSGWIAFRVLWVRMSLLEVHVRMEKIFAMNWGFSVFYLDPFIVFAKIENIFN